MGATPARRSIHSCLVFCFLGWPAGVTGLGSPRYCSSQRMRAISGGSGHTRLLVSTSGRVGILASSGAGFFFLPACAAGVSDNARALTPNNSSIFRRFATQERNANIFITLQYFLDDNSGRTPIRAADPLRAWRAQRRNAAGDSSDNLEFSISLDRWDQASPQPGGGPPDARFHP